MYDLFFASLLTDSHDLTKYNKANSFLTFKLTSLNKEEWGRLISEESKLEVYLPYCEAIYMIFAWHSPIESQAMLIADFENQRMKLETKVLSEITNNIMMAGK